jgi:hypothetical protein
MATQYKISLGHYNISFTKLDTDEYVFSAEHNYMEYYGKSYLKSLAFVTDFNGYLSNMSNAIKIKHIDVSGSIMIELPIPFSDKLEIVSLKIVEVDEFKKLNAVILRNSNEIKKEITMLKNKADASVTKVLNSQLKTNGEIMGRIKTLEKNFAALSSEVKELEERYESDRKVHYLILSLINDGTCTIKKIIFASDPSLESRIVSYIKKNNVEDRLGIFTFNMRKSQHKTLEDMITLIGSNCISRNIQGFIEILCKLHIRVTNSSSMLGGYSCYLEYALDEKIKSVDISIQLDKVTDDGKKVIAFTGIGFIIYNY